MAQQAGFAVKNQLSMLEADQRTVLEDLIKKGTKSAAAPAKPTAPAVLPGVVKAIPTLPTRARTPTPAAKASEAPPAPAPVEPPPVAEPVQPAATAPAAEPKKPAVLPTIRDRVPHLTPGGPPPAAPAPTSRPPETPAAKPPEPKPELKPAAETKPPTA